MAAPGRRSTTKLGEVVLRAALDALSEDLDALADLVGWA